MDSSRYADTPSLVQLLGCLIDDITILDDEGKYFLTTADFVKEFHQIIFASLSNMHTMGVRQVTVQSIENYLQSRPHAYATYKANDGARFLLTAAEQADRSNFDYYYAQTKKFTLLREYNKIGIDVSWIYDPDELDQSKRETKIAYLNSLSLDEIADQIDNKIARVRAEYVDNSSDDSISASAGIDELFASLAEAPDVGQPMYGDLVNTVTRGMRLGKFYLRSAATGVGKTRSMIADFCNCGCSKIWKDGEWQDNGLAFPAFFISTELELEEIQTMMVSFLADIDEEYILNNIMSFEEQQRAKEAIEIIKESPLYVEVIPDFNLKDIENSIKRSIRMYEVQYVFLDYIHTSMKILEEITRRSGGVRLREDNVLFLLSVKLKEIATQYNVFILSSTQLNQDWKTSDIPDQNLLRGAKSIADKIDMGMILLDTTDEDREKLANVIGDGMRMPNVKLSIYKNRRGMYNRCYIWMYANKGTCRFDGVFCTTYNYELVPIGELNISMRT